MTIPAALVAGGLDLLGGVASEANARDAFKHRYQDTVADMKAAGLNPALAYGQGGGNPQTVDYPDIGTAAIRGAQTAAQAKQASANTELTTAQAKLLEAQTADLINKTFWEMNTARENARLTSGRADLTATQADVAANSAAANISGAKSTADLLRLQVPEQQAIAKFFGTVGAPGTGGAINAAKVILELLRGIK